ncbi:MAG: LptF/LptG family permease, partial [Myxococcota bacterium]
MRESRKGAGKQRIITRYILKQIVGPLVATLVLTNVVLILLQVMQLGDVVFGSGFSGSLVTLLAFLMLPHFLVITIPLAVLASLI